MRTGASSCYFLVNFIFYFFFLVFLFDIVTYVISSENYRHHRWVKEVTSTQTTTTTTNQKITDSLSCLSQLNNFKSQSGLLKNDLDKKWSIYQCVHGCNHRIEDLRHLNETAATYKLCALYFMEKYWGKKDEDNFQITLKDGVVFQVGNFNFECFDVDVQVNPITNTLNAYLIPQPVFKKYRIKSQTKRNYLKDSIMNQLFQVIIKVIGEGSQGRIRQILQDSPIPLQAIFLVYLGFILLCMFLGDGPTKVTQLFHKWRGDDKTGKKPKADEVPKVDEKPKQLSHDEKMEEGHKIIEYLYQTKQQKYSNSIQKGQAEVPQVTNLKNFLNQPSFKLKLLTGNKGTGVESTIRDWIKAESQKGTDIIHYNVKYLINCFERIGVKNDKLSTLDCLMEAIIFERDRGFMAIFTAVKMNTYYILRAFLEVMYLHPIFALVNTFLIFWASKLVEGESWFLYEYFTWMGWDYFKWVNSWYTWGLITAYVYFSFLRQFLLVIKTSYNTLMHKVKTKTILIIQNIDQISQETIEDTKFPDLLSKCFQAQQLKKHDITFISRSNNFNEKLLKKGNISFEKHTINYLTLNSVRQVIKSRGQLYGKKGEKNTQLGFGYLFAYFFDNTQDVFVSMKKTKIDRKYIGEASYYSVGNNEARKKGLLNNFILWINKLFAPVIRILSEILKKIKIEIRYIDEAPPDSVEYVNGRKKELLNNIISEINKVFSQAKRDMSEILSVAAYKNLMKHLKNHQAEQDFQYMEILLERIFDVHILQYPNFKTPFGRLDFLMDQDERNPAFRSIINHARGIHSIQILTLLGKWYVSKFRTIYDSDIMTLCNQFGEKKGKDDKEKADIAEKMKKSVVRLIYYLNRKKMFFANNFSSSVYVVAFFMWKHRINSIEFSDINFERNDLEL